MLTGEQDFRIYVERKPGGWWRVEAWGEVGDEQYGIGATVGEGQVTMAQIKLVMELRRRIKDVGRSQ
jgi:hypothetical protein